MWHWLYNSPNLNIKVCQSSIEVVVIFYTPDEDFSKSALSKSQETLIILFKYYYHVGLVCELKLFDNLNWSTIQINI